MDIIAKDSGGHNIVAREMAVPRYYPAGTAPVAYVYVYWRYEGTPIGDAQLLGRFALGAHVSFPYNPAVDLNILFAVVSYTADNVPDVSNLEDAVWTRAVFQRELDAPTVMQVGDATQTTLQLAIDGYTAFARKRRVRVADNSSMTGAVELVTDNTETGTPLQRVIIIDRDVTETDAQTIYVRVSHSSGGAYGAESEAEAFTFADSGGAGGSSGPGTSYGHENYHLDEL
jgi:hypothetical protein